MKMNYEEGDERWDEGGIRGWKGKKMQLSEGMQERKKDGGMRGEEEGERVNMKESEGRLKRNEEKRL